MEFLKKLYFHGRRYHLHRSSGAYNLPETLFYVKRVIMITIRNYVVKDKISWGYELTMCQFPGNYIFFCCHSQTIDISSINSLLVENQVSNKSSFVWYHDRIMIMMTFCIFVPLSSRPCHFYTLNLFLTGMPAGNHVSMSGDMLLGEQGVFCRGALSKRIWQRVLRRSVYEPKKTHPFLQ